MDLNILFLTSSGETLPSVRSRVLPFVALGQEHGLDVGWKRIPKSVFSRYTFFSRLPKADVYIVQNKLFSAKEVKSLKRRCGKLVFDIDVAGWTMSPGDLLAGKNRRREPKMARRFAHQCSEADMCIVGNRFLAEKVAQYQSDISIIPTGVDTRRFVPAPTSKEQAQIIAGWMGTAGYLEYVEDPLALLKEKIGVLQFSVVSNKQYTGEGKECVFWSTWSPENEVAQLQNMDIGLMPLEDSVYARGKCGFSILQYMACGAVPVASDVGFNAEIIDHGIDGFLVREPEDWVRHALKLTEDSALRSRMAQAARQKVVDEFDQRKLALDLWKALEV